MDGTVPQRCISKLKIEVRICIHLLFNKFIMNRIISELIKIGHILTSFSVTKRSCDDTLKVGKKKIRHAVLEKYANKFWHHFDYELWTCDIKSDFKLQ